MTNKINTKLYDTLRKVFILTEGPWDNPVISEELYNEIKDTLQQANADICLKSPDGKHEYVPPPDSFDNPYCKHCYKGS
jgi:hypothetical protein